MVKNNSINNEEISSTKNLNHQDLSEKIKIEKEQSYDVWNRDSITIPYRDAGGGEGMCPPKFWDIS